MNRGKILLGSCVGALVLAAGLCAGLAQGKTNPYLSISERNPFALKDPPPPAPPPQEQPPPPPPAATIKLTGITTILSKTKALLEITEPGEKAPFKPIMEVGDKQGAIELLAIDVDKGEVRIRNGDSETNVAFEVASLAPETPPPPPNPAAAAAAAAAARRNALMQNPGAAAPPPAASEPSSTVITSSRSGGSSRGGGVVLSGGASAPSTAASALSSVPTVGAGGAVSTGMQPIPARQIRTPTTSASARPMTREEALIQLELQRQMNQGKGLPPLPPPVLPPSVQH